MGGTGSLVALLPQRYPGLQSSRGNATSLSNCPFSEMRQGAEEEEYLLLSIITFSALAALVT